MERASSTLPVSTFTGNEGGDWIDAVAPLYGMKGNCDADPLFCDPMNLDFGLRGKSQCLPGNNPEGALIGAHEAGCNIFTGVCEQLPGDAAGPLLGNYPNPFNPLTTIIFRVIDEGGVTVAIYDIAGRHIATLADRHYRRGTKTLQWNGEDATGRPVSSGTYIVSMRSGGKSASRKINLLR